MASRRSRRPLFRQRRSFGSRLGSALGVLLIVFIAVVALLYVTLPWTSGLAARAVLHHQGWGPATLHVDRFDIQHLDLRDVSLANGAVTLSRLKLTYAARDLWHRQITDVAVSGLTVNAKVSASILSVGPWQYPPPPRLPPMPETGLVSAPPSSPPPVQRLPIRHISIADSKAVVDLSGTQITLPITADLAADTDRWEGRVTAEVNARQGDAPANLVKIDWQGVFVPSDPEGSPSKGTIDLNATDFTLANDAGKLSAHGHLEFATGDGVVALTSPERITVNFSTVSGPVVAGLPEAWAARLANGVALYAAGSKGGGLGITWRTENDAYSAQADLDIGLSAGETWARSVFRGKMAGASGGPPDDVTLDEIRLEANRLPLALGELTGNMRIGDVTGPFVTAQGTAKADIIIAKPMASTFSAVSLVLNADTRFRVDGQTIAFTPQKMVLTLNDAILSGATLPGQASLTLAEPQDIPPGASQLMTLVFGGAPTLTFGLSTSARDIQIIPAPRDGAAPTPITLDLAKVRLEGYAAPGAGRYDLGLTLTNGTVRHSVGDLQLIGLKARVLPGSATGDGVAQVMRLLGTPQKSPGLGGTVFKYNVSLQNQVIDFKSILSSTKGVDFGQLTARLSLADGTGSFKFSTDKLAFGDAGIAAQDIFSSSFPLANLTGTAEMSASADWGLLKGGHSAGRLVLSDMAFQSASTVASGLNATIAFSSLSPLKTAGAQHISLANLTAGLPFKDLGVDVSLPGTGTMAVTNGTAAVAGGKATLTAPAVPMSGNNATLPLTLSRIGLGSLTAQAGINGLSAAGSMSGTLPLRLDDGTIWVDNGKLKSDAPGRITYKPEKPPAALAGSGEIVLKALSNFEYDSMIAVMNGDLLNNLRVALAINGKNPELANGYPISFNLNLGGPLGTILTQGVTGYRLKSDMIPGLTGNHEAKESVGDSSR